MMALRSCIVNDPEELCVMQRSSFARLCFHSTLHAGREEIAGLENISIEDGCAWLHVGLKTAKRAYLRQCALASMAFRCLSVLL